MGALGGYGVTPSASHAGGAHDARAAYSPESGCRNRTSTRIETGFCQWPDVLVGQLEGGHSRVVGSEVGPNRLDGEVRCLSLQ